MGTPLTTDPYADELRRRAALLRRFAARLDDVTVDDLVRRAGTDTWLGPAADDCHADLSIQRDSLTTSADELRSHAKALDARAEARSR